MNPTNWNQIRLNEIIRTYTNSKVTTKYGFYIFFLLSIVDDIVIVIVSGNTMRQFLSCTNAATFQTNMRLKTTNKNMNRTKKKHTHIFERRKKNHIPLIWKPYTISECLFCYIFFICVCARILYITFGVEWTSSVDWKEQKYNCYCICRSKLVPRVHVRCNMLQILERQSR